MLFYVIYIFDIYFVFPDSSVGKESACNAGDPSLIPGSRRSAGEGIGYPLQCSWASFMAQLVKNLPPMLRPRCYPWVGKIPWEGYALQYSGLENTMECIVHGVTKSRTQLSDFHSLNRENLVSQRVKNLPATCACSLGPEDPLEKG